MKFKTFFILLSFLINIPIFSQVENIPADHPVYPFLRKMKVQGVIKNYNDVILPLSKEKILSTLYEVRENRGLLSSAEKRFLERMIEKIEVKEEALNIFDNFPSGFFENISSDEQKHLYNYKDSVIAFYIDPIFDYKLIYSDKFDAGSSLLNYGGKLRGSYDNWFGFSLQGTIGLQFGNRDAALLDKRVQQSFTFNETGINYFDATEGYLRLSKGIVNLQLGRERILWGSGNIDKMILTDNAQKFDFIKFNISYKTFDYTFLHGWLVQPPFVAYTDTLTGDVKQTQPKYIAVSRLGINPGDELNFGVSQVIIYSNRPFEAAYLNPFLFWESAQRSLNDLDNSYLSFDGRYLIINGLEINASIIFDDIKFDNYTGGNWTARNNRLAWQSGFILTDPLLFKNLTLKFEYSALRPYMFSHFGLGEESLTYTNNGNLLGIDLQPNSTRIAGEAEYRINERLNLILTFKHSLHGANEFDNNGNLIRSFGGDVFRPIFSTDPEFVSLLDGVREEEDELIFRINYEILYGIYLDFVYNYRNFNTKNISEKTHDFRGALRLNLD